MPAGSSERLYSVGAAGFCLQSAAAEIKAKHAPKTLEALRGVYFGNDHTWSDVTRGRLEVSGCWAAGESCLRDKESEGDTPPPPPVVGGEGSSSEW